LTFETLIFGNCQPVHVDDRIIFVAMYPYTGFYVNNWALSIKNHCTDQKPQNNEWVVKCKLHTLVMPEYIATDEREVNY